MRHALVGFVVLLGACAAGPTDTVRGTLPAAVRTATTSAVLSGHTVAIDAYLWRDFQPIAPTDGKPLIATVRARTADGTSLGAGVSADSMWVIAGTEAWAARAVQEQARSATGPYLEVVARDGPKWAPGTHVDVVVRLRDGSGQAVYVRVADQMIARTE